ncbi:MAG: hypothetical protein OHK0029_27370 [Armatimonadaceae bacterium]
MEEQDSPASQGRLLAAMGIAVAVIGIIVVLIIGQKPQQTEAPAKLVPYTAPDKAFACILPESRKRTESAGGGIQSGVRADAGRSRIKVSADLSGSLMADIAKAQDAQVQNMTDMLPQGMQPPPTQRKSPVEKMHIAFRKNMEESWDEYAEVGSSQFQSAFGESHVTEWTGKKKSLIGAGDTHGLRVTMLSGERRITVLCYCSESDWKALRPTFSKVIKSIAPGGA